MSYLDMVFLFGVGVLDHKLNYGPWPWTTFEVYKMSHGHLHIRVVGLRRPCRVGSVVPDGGSAVERPAPGHVQATPGSCLKRDTRPEIGSVVGGVYDRSLGHLTLRQEDQR